MTNPSKGSKPYVRDLVVNLRCEWCKELFRWPVRYKANIEKRIPRTCSDRCRAQLRNWEVNKERGLVFREGP